MAGTPALHACGYPTTPPSTLFCPVFQARSGGLFWPVDGSGDRPLQPGVCHRRLGTTGLSGPTAGAWRAWLDPPTTARALGMG